MQRDAVYQKPGQASRDIKVLVLYKESDVVKQTRGRTPTIHILVRNDGVTGISSTEIDTGQDKIKVFARCVSNEKWFRMKILSQNYGFLKLELK